jgi:hypothetical protein
MSRQHGAARPVARQPDPREGRSDPAARPKAQAFVNRRYRGIVDEVERAKNRTKSKVRGRVEHSIGVTKRVLGFAKVRYRGLNKNVHRLLVTCALANLFMARRHLLRCQEVKSCPPCQSTDNPVRPESALAHHPIAD